MLKIKKRSDDCLKKMQDTDELERMGKYAKWNLTPSLLVALIAFVEEVLVPKEYANSQEIRDTIREWQAFSRKRVAEQGVRCGSLAYDTMTRYVKINLAFGALAIAEVYDPDNDL